MNEQLKSNSVQGDKKVKAILVEQRKENVSDGNIADLLPSRLDLLTRREKLVVVEQK